MFRCKSCGKEHSHKIPMCLKCGGEIITTSLMFQLKMSPYNKERKNYNWGNTIDRTQVLVGDVILANSNEIIEPLVSFELLMYAKNIPEIFKPFPKGQIINPLGLQALPLGQMNMCQDKKGKTKFRIFVVPDKFIPNDFIPGINTFVRKDDWSIPPDFFEKNGFRANPTSGVNYSAGEHALGQHELRGHKTKYISGSNKILGADNFDGRRYWVDLNAYKANGGKAISNKELMEYIEALEGKSSHGSIITKERINWWKNAQKIEGEILFDGDIPGNAIKSADSMKAMWTKRGLGVVSMGFTINDLKKATEKSYEKGTPEPIVAETVRQVGGWAAGVAGSKAGFVVGTVLGVETGPGAIVFGLAGSIIFGIAGYFGADWVADHIDEN